MIVTPEQLGNPIVAPHSVLLSAVASSRILSSPKAHSVGRIAAKWTRPRWWLARCGALVGTATRPAC